jgi:hypothetical protein
VPTLLDLSLPLRCFKLTAELGLFASETEGIEAELCCYLIAIWSNTAPWVVRWS